MDLFLNSIFATISYVCGFCIDVRSMMFVHCGKMQDCELKLNGESFEGELHL